MALAAGFMRAAVLVCGCMSQAECSPVAVCHRERCGVVVSACPPKAFEHVATELKPYYIRTTDRFVCMRHSWDVHR